MVNAVWLSVDEAAIGSEPLTAVLQLLQGEASTPKWLFQHRGPRRQVFVDGVEVKATSCSTRNTTHRWRTARVGIYRAKCPPIGLRCFPVVLLSSLVLPCPASCRCVEFGLPPLLSSHHKSPLQPNQCRRESCVSLSSDSLGRARVPKQRRLCLQRVSSIHLSRHGD